MKTLRSLLLLAFIVVVVGCATASRDMQLANQGSDQIVDKDYAHAEKSLKEALALNENNSYALLNLGVVYQETGRYDEARQKYEKVIELGEKEVPARTNYDKNRGKSLVDLAKQNLQLLSSQAQY